MLTDTDLRHLGRCLVLATEALNTGNEPFGSIIVSEDGRVLAEDYNRTGSGDPTLHPEFELSRWAVSNMGPEERAAATVYTSGEHCPMCSAAHGLVGLGRIVYASSAEQLANWRADMGLPLGPVKNLPIQEVAPEIEVDGPAPELAEQIHALHQLRNVRKKKLRSLVGRVTKWRMIDAIALHSSNKESEEMSPSPRLSCLRGSSLQQQ